MDIGEAEITALRTERQLLMVESQQVQDCRLQVVHMHLVFGDAEAEFVGFAIGETGFHTATSQKHSEAIRIMVAPENFTAGSAAFAERCAAKFTAPNDQGF